MTLLLTVIVVALIFEFINGFHDTANSVAAVVGTKVLTPRQAILLAAMTNLLEGPWREPPSPPRSEKGWSMPTLSRAGP